MALSKSSKIKIFLAIDTIFFLLEIIVGYAVHSLALVADAFHMLNDVLSLCVGLWAVKVATSRRKSDMYTYGWQRAETLGALVNGVFLVALCLSIFLEAIQRLVEPQEVKHPQLVLIVGACGLLFNILGLLLFHDHSHGHGHSHGHNESDVKLEEGNLTSHNQDHGHSHSHSIHAAHTDQTNQGGKRGGWLSKLKLSKQQEFPESAIEAGFSRNSTPSHRESHKNTTSPCESRLTGESSRKRSVRHVSGLSGTGKGLEEIHVHPASFRSDIIATSRLETSDTGVNTTSSGGGGPVEDENEHRLTDNVPGVYEDERSPLFCKVGHEGSFTDLHADHKHARGDGHGSHGGKGGHSHSHADLNLRGIFLHVLGDALGNVGVIATSLIIWFVKSRYRFYADPVISLVITALILTSAVPLCQAASRILLQAVPAGLSVDDIRQDIEKLPGIGGCHHLHVWQLSDTKLVASLHVRILGNEVEREANNGDGRIKHSEALEQSAKYMALARNIQHCLHEYGIHSSTIQPEFYWEEEETHDQHESSGGGQCDKNCQLEGKRRFENGQGLDKRLRNTTGQDGILGENSDAAVANGADDSMNECLLECVSECAQERRCCARETNGRDSD